MSIQGNIQGIPKNILEQLETWGDYRFPRNYVLDEALALALAAFSARLNRELAVYVNRQGRVVYLAVGKDSTVPLAESLPRRGRGLTGLRCIHTHPGGSGQLSQVDLAALKQLDLDCMAALGVDENGGIVDASLAWGVAGEEEIFHYPSLEALLEVDFPAMLRERQTDKAPPPLAKEQEEAILVALGRPGEELTESLAELARLAESAGIKVIGKMEQNRHAPSASTYIGRGKAEELALMAQALDADVLIFDDEISPSAQMNLNRITGRKVIDRTFLILDIFAQRARSNEGKIQVELAQLRYLLPRLMGQGQVLSRLGGGIGTRGPGETQLETDRRGIRRRIQELEARQKAVMRTRRLHRQKRQKEELPLAALVGYTNAGKSTLLNALSGADAQAEDRLFSTLDSLTRRVALPGGQNLLLSDTVGFIRRLPHHLVAAFRSTLEEVKEADLLLHVVDGSAKDAPEQFAAVMQVLGELEVLDKPMLTVINKSDLIPEGQGFPGLEGEKLLISAKQGLGLTELLQKIENSLPHAWHTLEVEIPFTKGNLLAQLHEEGQVLEEEYTQNGIRIKARMPEKILGRLRQEGLV